MKRTFLLKTLLLAVGLLTGTNSWAEIYTGTVAFSGVERCTWENGVFTTGDRAGNLYALAIADLSTLSNIESATSITLEFDVTVSGRLLIGIGDKTVRGETANGSSKSTYNTDGLVMRYGTSDGTYVRVNGGTNNSNLLNTSSHVVFTLDRANKKYSYTITYADGNKETQTGLTGSNISTSVNNATIVEAYSWNNNQSNALSSVSYSYEYSASSFNYSIKAVTANETVLKTIASGTSVESITTYYPYAINVDGDWYTTASSTYAVTVSSINPTANIVYEKDEQIVGYYEESASGTNSQFSNGAYGTVAAQNKRDRGTVVGSLPPGQYQFIARLVADGNSGRAITLREGANDPIVSAIANNTTKTVTENFTLYATTENLFINGANSGTEKTNLSTSFDYIVIKRVGDAAVPATIGSYGYATFSSTYPLDFSNVTDLNAYIATGVNDGTVMLTQVTGAVPANTGLVIKGEPNTYDIPVAASADEINGNLLVACAQDTEVEALIGATKYVMSVQEGKVVFARIGEDKATVAAGHAYLSVPITSARNQTLTIGDDASGIADVTVKGVKDGETYNLRGQRVSKPTKGLYIIDGSKVVIK